MNNLSCIRCNMTLDKYHSLIVGDKKHYGDENLCPWCLYNILYVDDDKGRSYLKTKEEYSRRLELISSGKRKDIFKSLWYKRNVIHIRDNPSEIISEYSS